MALVLKNRVKEETTTTGTGAFALGGASAQFDTFQTYMSNGDTTYYSIAPTTAGTDEWEIGIGTWNTGNTLSRTTVLAGSNGTSAVDFSAGTKEIFMTYPADKAVFEDGSGNISVSGTVDGRDLATDGTKLDGIESGATADQTKSDIDALNINADQVDGVHASSFVRSDADDTVSKQLTFPSAIGDRPILQGGFIGRQTDDGDADIWGISETYYPSHSTAGYGWGIRWASTPNEIQFVGNNANKMRIDLDVAGLVYIDDNKVWHAGNDGSGSGLDADTVDGIQASSFLRSDANDTSNSTITMNTLKLGDGNDGRFFSDTNGRTAFADGDFYIQNTVGNYYNYATNQYLGASSGDNLYCRGNTISGNSWSITGGGAATFAGTLTLSQDGQDVINFSANDTNDNRGIAFNSRTALSADYNDGWLRLNNGSEFSNGTYTPTTFRIDGTLQVAGRIQHVDDSDTYIDFATNDIHMVAGNHTELYITTTGVRLGDTGNGYFQPVSGNYGSIQIDGGAHGGWEGYSIGGRVVLMHDNSSGAGIYNDVNNEWLVYTILNDRVSLYYNGSEKFRTQSGGAYCYGTLTASGNVTAYSDEKLKDNIEPIENPIEKVKAIQGVTFNRNDIEDNPRQTGVIAQQVEKVLPEVVKTDEFGTKTVAYGNMVGLLIEAIKEQQKQIDELKDRLA